MLLSGAFATRMFFGGEWTEVGGHHHRPCYRASLSNSAVLLISLNFRVTKQTKEVSAVARRTQLQVVLTFICFWWPLHLSNNNICNKLTNETTNRNIFHLCVQQHSAEQQIRDKTATQSVRINQNSTHQESLDHHQQDIWAIFSVKGCCCYLRKHKYKSSRELW